MERQSRGGGAARLGQRAGKWFVKPEAKLSCDTIVGQRVMFFHVQRCCDVQPPPQFGCWYGMDELAPLSEVMADAVGLQR